MAAIIYNPRESWTVRTGLEVIGSELNDTIVNGAYPEDSLVGAYGSDQYEGHNIRIWGNEGKDVILNYGYNVTVLGGDDNDSIRNFGSNVRISGNEGSDKFIISGASENNTITDFTDGEDELWFEQGAVKAEIDTYYAKPSVVIKSAETGDTLVKLEDVTSGSSNRIVWRKDNGDTMTTSIDQLLASENPTLPSSDDTLSPIDNVIYGTPNDDTLENSRNNVRIEALAGNDKINNYSDNVTINGDDGNDNIQSYGKKTSIVGGKGDDFLEIWSEAQDATIKAGDGNDDILLSGGISASADGGAGDDNFWIWLGSKKATVDGGDGKDSFEIGDESLLAYGGNGNDTFYATSGKNSTLYGDAGNDYILLRDTKTKFLGGKGDDTIRIKSEAVDATINGGEDSDIFIVNLSTYNGQSRLGNSAVIQDYESGKDKIVLEEMTLDNYSINDSDVILTFKSESISDYKLILENTLGKEITFIDSDGNKSTKTYKDENIFDEDEPYWTLDDLKVFLDAFNQFKSLGKLSDVFDMSVRIIDIFELVIDIAQNNREYLDSTGELTEIIGDTINIIGDVRSLKGKNDLFWSLSASGLRCLGKFINTFDVDNLSSNEESKKELREKSKELAEEIADLANESVETTIKALSKLSSISQAEANALAKQVRLKANAAISVLMAGYMGFVQYQESLEQYSAEELPLSIVAGETFIDAIAAGLHGGAHQYTYGLDDLAFKGLRWVFSFGQAPPTDKNYMEWIAEGIKVITFGSTSAGDTIEIDHNGQTLNAQAGDDYIRNVFSNVEIYGERGNDTIFSREARRNYLHGGSGRDYIIVSDTKSTAMGASENDKIMSTGNGNSISGGEGTDFIFVKDASENIINGGIGIDIIALENAQNTVIYYAKGDGSDIIFGYDEDDTIHIAGKTEYTVIENGQDINIKVGEDTIILNEAAGKNIKIENRDTTDNPIDDINPFETNPVINSNISKIRAKAAENVVTDLDSLNELTANETSILTFTENSGRGIQNINLRSSEYPQVVSLEGGDQNVQFNDTNGNAAIVGESASGSKNIIFGNGDDLGIFFSPNADINATLGSGKDSILVDNDAHVKVDMTDGGAAKIIPYSGSVTLDNYNSSTGAAVQTQVDDLTSAIENGDIELFDNQIKLKSSTVIVNDSLDGSTLVNLTPSKGASKKVWFTGINGDSLNTKDRNGSFLLIGNYSANPFVEQNRRGSSITASNGNNTIFAGSRDFIDGSDGYNQIYLTHSDLRQSQAGAIVAIGGNGRNTIHRFNEGFGYEADAVRLDDLNKLNFNFDTDGLILSFDNARLIFDDNDSKESKLIQLTDDSSTINAAFVQAEHSFISQNEDDTPDVFFGTHSALNFYGYNDDLSLDLSQNSGKLGNKDIKLYGIDKLQGGDKSSTLIGNDGNNILVAGKGQTSIQSGAGHDKLFGNTDEDKNVATFYYMQGDGRDSIKNFDFMTNAQDVTADKVQLDDNSAVTDVFLRGSDVMIKVDNADGFLMLEDAQGKSFRLNNDLIAKVDTNVEFDGFSNCFVGIGTMATLTVGKNLGNVEVWLSDDLLEYHGTMYDGNFKVLDASQADGSNILAGNELNNSIVGGFGSDSLWGGYTSSNDTLVSGSGHNTFFYLQGNGRDVIQNAHDGDNIILDDITLDQIAEANITTGGVAINFTDGGSLTINGTANLTYQLADGSKYSANHSTLEWQDK